MPIFLILVNLVADIMSSPIILNEKAIMEIIDMPSEQVGKLNMENKTNFVFRSHIINIDTVIIVITTTRKEEV